MNYGNPPPYLDPGPTAPYPPYVQQPGGPQAYCPAGTQGPYPTPNTGYPYQGYPQYGWQDRPHPEPPKITVYVVEDQRRDDTGQATYLTDCWTAFCCCYLWDMLT
ncbi:cysteine-rich and transmembrane domain-containing protein 1-like [Trichosurus vulpecula]|uniref:cysteine-rich and transmembrane domain-containing protein 1-like n=1 Tax=Trichosurus vulpecula TaxID=9337 RepID=UPI00186B0E40|nr:cysteine-rich and transmembrane domain-containing protein 1-like [Trichosurus vulpecula]